jgi:hypothetical protein
LGIFWEFKKKSVIAKISENLSNFQNPKIGEKKNHHPHQGKKSPCVISVRCDLSFLSLCIAM